MWMAPQTTSCPSVSSAIVERANYACACEKRYPQGKVTRARREGGRRVTLSPWPCFLHPYLLIGRRGKWNTLLFEKRSRRRLRVVLSISHRERGVSQAWCCCAGWKLEIANVLNNKSNCWTHRKRTQKEGLLVNYVVFKNWHSILSRVHCMHYCTLRARAHLLSSSWGENETLPKLRQAFGVIVFFAAVIRRR